MLYSVYLLDRMLNTQLIKLLTLSEEMSTNNDSIDKDYGSHNGMLG